MAHILLIESDHMLAKNVASFFKGRGHKVDWANHAQEAIHIADTKTPDAIILDLLLASHGGVEFLYELRSYPEWQTLPVIIYSQVSREELGNDLDSLKHLNISAYYYKPTTKLQDLATGVERLLQPTAAA